MSLQDWHRFGWLKEHKTSRLEIADLFAVADRDFEGYRAINSPACRVSLALLHPPVSGNPTDRLAGAAVDECLGIFHGQPARPFRKALLSEFGALRVGML